MDLLLDTCTFLWLAAEPERLGPRAREVLDADGARLFLSDASIWEVCLKWQARKLELPSTTSGAPSYRPCTVTHSTD